MNDADGLGRTSSLRLFTCWTELLGSGSMRAAKLAHQHDVIGVNLVELLNQIGAAGHRGDFVEFLVLAAGNHRFIVANCYGQLLLDGSDSRHGFLVRGKVPLHCRQVFFGILQVAAELGLNVFDDGRIGLGNCLYVGLKFLSIASRRFNAPRGCSGWPVGRTSDLVSGTLNSAELRLGPVGKPNGSE